MFLTVATTRFRRIHVTILEPGVANNIDSSRLRILTTFYESELNVRFFELAFFRILGDCSSSSWSSDAELENDSSSSDEEHSDISSETCDGAGFSSGSVSELMSRYPERKNSCTPQTARYFRTGCSRIQRARGRRFLQSLLTPIPRFTRLTRVRNHPQPRKHRD